MNLWQMSLSGAVIIILITVVRAVLINRLPKKTFLVLWGLALLRLLVPFSIPYEFSFYSLFAGGFPKADIGNVSPLISLLQSSSEKRPLSGEMNPSLAEDVLLEGEFLKGILTGEVIQRGFVSPWKIAWFLGFVIFIGIFLACYMVCLRNFKTSLPISEGYVWEWLKKHPIKRRISVRRFDRISSPLTYGIVHPVILLPKTVDLNDTQQLGFILKHELVHICRLDLLTKMIATIALCIHWFNPFVWVFYILLNRDLELSCDERVISQFDKVSRADYARALICMEERRSVSNLLFSSFSKNVMEERIVAIMKPKKYTLLGAVGALALVVLIAAGFLTSAQAAEPDETGGNSVISAEGTLESAASDLEKQQQDLEEYQQKLDEIMDKIAEEDAKYQEAQGAHETENASMNTAGNDTSVSSKLHMIWPTESISISLTYGERMHPLTGQIKMVDHICIKGEKGDDVYAAISGTVTEAAYDADNGNYVILVNANGMTTIYAHLQEFVVSVGDVVTAGDVIGTMGATGMATGPNLAFSVVVDGAPVDPMSFEYAE